MDESPDTVKNRQGKLSRFARLQVIREEEKRRLLNESAPKRPEVERHYERWRTEAADQDYREKELEYTIPYKEELKNGPKPAQETASSNLLDDDCASTVTATATNVSDSLINQLALLRSRAPNQTRRLGNVDGGDNQGFNEPLRSQPAPRAESSINQFEMVSTILAPTEINSSQSPSNISVEQIKQTYFRDYKRNEKLPISSQRKQIIDCINSYSVCIIQGATGCGKTTQVPTYILENAILERPTGRAPAIYVTQPRKIAAKSIAERVSAEHEWLMPGLVGYQVGLDKQCTPDTVLIFCTAGVLLQKIIQEKSLKNYTHIIIDEAHERDADTDLLMMMIRKLMMMEMPVFRLIIMSATMDIDKLRQYFTFRTHFGHQAETTPSYINIGTQSKHATNIQTVYLDTLRASFNVCENVPDFDHEQPELFDDCLKAAVKIIVEIVPRLDNYSEATKSTLVFLPGLAEISKLDRLIRATPGASDCFDIIPLHSCLSTTDQFRVFKRSPKEKRKIILATNIAESSITVPDVGFIVDFCLTKNIMKDSVTRFPTLKLLWSTQDKSTQRSGRTGRCCAGKVFRMVPQYFYKQFDEFAKPELLTAPLELSVLRVKNFQMGEIKGLLAIVMDPPLYNEIRTAVLELKQIGALSATYDGQLSDIDGDLTELGHIISALPIDVHLSKLIVLAAAFDVLDDAIIVAACLSTNRSVVKYMYGNLFDSYVTKLNWSGGSQSDLFVSMDCYKQFKEHKDDNGRTDAWLVRWCENNQLDERKLHEVDAMEKEIINRLSNVNILAGLNRPNQQRDVDMDNLMLKIAFCASFYPNYFLSEDLDSEKIEKDLPGGFDATRTVYLSALPVHQGPIYKNQVTKQIADKVSPDFEYFTENSRAFLVFNDVSELSPEGSQRLAKAIDDDQYNVIQKSRTIPASVYKAIKYGECDDIKILEFKEKPLQDRMYFYQRQKEELAAALGTQKLNPTIMKVLYPNQRANNDALIEASVEDYNEIFMKRPYYEVNFDVKHYDIEDRELFKISQHETNYNVVPPNATFNEVYKRIRGPDSPLRMSFRSVLYKSAGFNVEIDCQSINSVLLDPEYADKRRQMLVAATVAQSKTGRVTARDTSLMPNIRGLPSLMSLLFAQYYRLIYNKKLDCLAGGIFGIGWSDVDDQPLDRQYEVDLAFDVLFTMNDIELINKARNMISQLLKFTDVKNVGMPQAKLQDDLRNVVLTLLRQKRYPLVELDIGAMSYPGAEDIFTKGPHNMECGIIQDEEAQPFLPLMKHTRDIKVETFCCRIRANLDHLHMIASSEEVPVPVEGIECLVCHNGVGSCYISGFNVEIHVNSVKHKKAVATFEVLETHVKARAE